jgi:hypothetical protein
MLNETHRAPPRYKISDFFSSLLEVNLRNNSVSEVESLLEFPWSQRQAYADKPLVREALGVTAYYRTRSCRKRRKA